MNNIRHKAVAAADLSAVAKLLGAGDCLVDEANGIFLAKLPTREEGYRLMVHPASKIVHEQVFANGTVEIVVRRG